MPAAAGNLECPGRVFPSHTPKSRAPAGILPMPPAPGGVPEVRAVKSLCLVFAAAMLVAAPVHAVTTRSLQAVVPVSGATRLALEFPIGELTVADSPDDDVHLLVRARCKHEQDDCQARIDALALETSRDGRTLRLRLLGTEHWKSNYKLTLYGTLQVPSSMAVRLEVGVGEVRVNDLSHDLSVKLGIGAAHVRQRRDLVRSVHLISGIGDANLRVSGHSMRRSGFVGHSLHWRDGTGESAIEVEVGIGETSVELN